MKLAPFTELEDMIMACLAPLNSSAITAIQSKDVGHKTTIRSIILTNMHYFKERMP